jgi:hypothetical protein
MALSQTNINLITLKKALGLSHTATAKALPANESIGTTAQLGTNIVFGETIPAAPISASLYDQTSGVVEYVRLELEEIAGTNGQGYAIKLPAGYQASSTNPNKGNGTFDNSKNLYETLGGIQIIPPGLFGTVYSPILYDDDGSATKGSGDVIPALDARDWIVDYYAGIYFQEDTANTTGVPAYLEAWIFIGDFADTAISNALSGAGIFKATGSFQATTNDLQVTGSLVVTDGVSGSFSGSFEGDGSGLTGIPSSAITGLQLFRISSGSVSASVDVDSTSIFNVISSSAELLKLDSTGTLTLQGDIVAENYIISSSVTYMTQSFSSGSTIFGDSLDDTHLFTGSLFITGSTFESIPQAGNSTMIGYLDTGSGEFKFSNIIDGGSF